MGNLATNPSNRLLPGIEKPANPASQKADTLTREFTGSLPIGQSYSGPSSLQPASPTEYISPLVNPEIFRHNPSLRQLAIDKMSQNKRKPQTVNTTGVGLPGMILNQQ